MESTDYFSEEEIQEQLAALGFTNIPQHRMQQFKRDLEHLIRHEKSKSSTSGEWRCPSAVTMEKVGLNLCCVFNHTSSTDHERQMTSTFVDEIHHHGGVQKENLDPYAMHSVLPAFHRPSTAPNRMEVVADPSQISDSLLHSSKSSCQDGGAAQMQGRAPLKRKVLRKHRGETLVCDESTHSEYSGAVSGLEEHLGRLRVTERCGHSNSEVDSGELDILSSGHESELEVAPTAFEVYCMRTRSHSLNDLPPRPTSFIRPMMHHPHTRNLRKTDPVTKYFQYKQHWETFKPPGESDRRGLHWAIREQLMYQPPPPKPQKTYIPNTYVVPTEKKRAALRWEIRHDLAKGMIPAKI